METTKTAGAYATSKLINVVRCSIRNKQINNGIHEDGNIHLINTDNKKAVSIYLLKKYIVVIDIPNRIHETIRIPNAKMQEIDTVLGMILNISWDTTTVTGSQQKKGSFFDLNRDK